MEHVIFSHFIGYLDNIDYLHPNRHGLRKQLSSATQSFKFVTDRHDKFRSFSTTDVIFSDLVKALDTVPHQCLLFQIISAQPKQHRHGLNGSILTGRPQAVTIHDVPSPLTNVKSHVPQGRVLGILLFLIYINYPPPP